MTPTEEQIKRLWEWCGFRKQEATKERPLVAGFKDPLGNELWGPLPDPDLNNLFRAVPKAMQKIRKLFNLDSDDSAYKALFMWWRENIAKGMRIKEALFWAIYKAAGLEE